MTDTGWLLFVVWRQAGNTRWSLLVMGLLRVISSGRFKLDTFTQSEYNTCNYLSISISFVLVIYPSVYK